jgi:hypothetical protein
LIRNTQYLCHGYINKLQSEKSSTNKKQSVVQPQPAPAADNKPSGDANGAENPNAATDEDEPIVIGKQQTYYVEENEKFLNLLISNCEPILGKIVNKFDRFNKINGIEQAFEQQQGASTGMYGDDSSDEVEDILGPIIEEFSIKEDV